LLASCGPRDATYDPSSFHVHGQIVPRDVAIPSGPADAAAEFNGLYTDSSAVLSCCWIAPQATLLVHKYGPAQTLVAGFRLPNAPRFDGGQTVTISFLGTAAPSYTEFLREGEQFMFKFPLPTQLRARTGLIPVRIVSSVEYVPGRDTSATGSLFTSLHLRTNQPDGDMRPLGAVLLYLYFQ
jgi:hypothetical protein